MELKYSKNTTTNEIKDAFGSQFAGLKIEVVKHSHGTGEGSARADIMHDEVTLSEINPSVTEGVITIEASDKVSEVEKMFSDNLGINVQVFRKEGRVWIETVNTDYWTLAEQMESAHS